MKLEETVRSSSSRVFILLDVFAAAKADLESKQRNFHKKIARFSCFLTDFKASKVPCWTKFPTLCKFTKILPPSNLNKLDAWLQS